MTWDVYLLALLAGLFAGFVNTLTGAGSVVTLSMLMFAGLSASAANATNRLGVLVQSAVGSYAFFKGGKLRLTNFSWLWVITPAAVGAAGGAYTATVINTENLETWIGVLMIFMLFLVVARPEKWLNEKAKNTDGKKWTTIVIFLAIGFYGGFFQAGIGILLLAALLLAAKYELKESNALKVFIVFIFTVPAFLIFWSTGQIQWLIGGVMATGQSIGAWVAAKFALQHPAAALWTRRLLIIEIVFSIVKIFKLHQYLLLLF